MSSMTTLPGLAGQKLPLSLGDGMQIHYLVDKPPKDGEWDGGVGYLTKDKAKQ